MKIKEYSYLSSQKLLSEIITDSKKLDYDVDSFDSYIKEYALSNSFDLKWAYISTSLLMSEGLFKNGKIYEEITPYILLELENLLGSSGCFSKSIPLDENNNAVYDFASLVHQPESNFDNRETYEYFDYLGNPVEIEEEPKEAYNPQADAFFEDFEQQREQERIKAINTNTSFIVDGNLKTTSFIKMVRNALAHSSYEIIDDPKSQYYGCIRLFHYNHDKKNLDMNIILNEDMIIPIIDILNEIVYKKYKDFYYEASCVDMSHSEYYGPLSKDDSHLIDFILSFDVCDNIVAQRILKEAKKRALYNKPSYDLDLSDVKEELLDNENQLKAICQVMKEYVDPLYDSGIMINNLMYTKNNMIDSDALFDKYGIYDYLKDDFYPSAHMLNDDPVYKMNMLRLKIMSLLNCLLLTNMNVIHNENLDNVILDFSDMDIPKEIINLFEVKQLRKNEVLKEQTKSEIVSNVKKGLELKNKIKNKKQILVDNYRDIDYYNKVLPLEIKNMENLMNLLLIERREKGKIYLEAMRNPLEYNYDLNLSVYVLNALRNSLAHGNVRFDDAYFDIGDTQITFEDYNPDNPSELTFKGSISLCELIKILISKDNLEVLKK